VCSRYTQRVGLILEPTANMAPFRVECRSESFYLTTGERDVDRYLAQTETGWSVPLANAPALAAAIRQVIEQLARWGLQIQPTYEYSMSAAASNA
jgi:hypothetical protein